VEKVGKPVVFVKGHVIRIWVATGDTNNNENINNPVISR